MITGIPPSIFFAPNGCYSLYNPYVSEEGRIISLPVSPFVIKKKPCVHAGWRYSTSRVITKRSQGEQGWRGGAGIWRNGESACLSPMCPGFDVGSLLCSERYFAEYLGFPLSSKNKNFQITILDWKMSLISARVLDTLTLLKPIFHYLS